MTAHLAARISHGEALRLFRRRSWRHRLLSTLLVRRSTNSKLPRAETVWLPFYLIDFTAEAIEGQEEPHAVSVIVEGYSAAFAVFERHPWLVEGPPPGEHFPPALSEEDAVKAGRRELLQALLRYHGHKSKFRPGEVTAIRVIYLPCWVYYYERRRNKIDFLVLDAITGERGGGKTKRALIEAFCAEP